jgi:hypothetical protein
MPMFTIRRHGGGPIECIPRSYRVDAEMFGFDAASQHGIFRLTAPKGWIVTPVGALTWEVTPGVVDPEMSYALLLTRENGEQRSLPVGITLDLRSTFDPLMHTFPEPNRASVLGDILPSPDIFERTFSRLPSWLQSDLFTGLYSDIVFLRKDGPTRGGLCSGMARWSIARSLGEEPDPRDREDALRRITTYHGRQLSDLSFLMGAPSFLRGSPRASYRALRRDLLHHGKTDRAFDVAVPKPWRKDLLKAMVTQGHTIVPYRIVQPSPDRATVEVYDPNRPPVTLETPEKVEFDLRRDRYSYRHLVSMEQNDVGLVVARQRGYARAGTAFAAGLVAMGMRLAGIQARQRPAGEPAGR